MKKKLEKDIPHTEEYFQISELYVLPLEGFSFCSQHKNTLYIVEKQTIDLGQNGEERYSEWYKECLTGIPFLQQADSKPITKSPFPIVKLPHSLCTVQEITNDTISKTRLFTIFQKLNRLDNPFSQQNEFQKTINRMGKIDFHELWNYLAVLEQQTIHGDMEPHERQAQFDKLSALIPAVSDCITLGIDNEASFIASYMYLHQKPSICWQSLVDLHTEYQKYLQEIQLQQEHVKIYKGTSQ